jgi:hypothetical protein
MAYCNFLVNNFICSQGVSYAPTAGRCDIGSPARNGPQQIGKRLGKSLHVAAGLGPSLHRRHLRRPSQPLGDVVGRKSDLIELQSLTRSEQVAHRRGWADARRVRPFPLGLFRYRRCRWRRLVVGDRFCANRRYRWRRIRAWGRRFLCPLL